MTNGVWPKAEAADIFNHAHDSITQVPTNTKLHEAGLGNWYLGKHRAGHVLCKVQDQQNSYLEECATSAFLEGCATSACLPSCFLDLLAF
jgi:hypothetical protein